MLENLIFTIIINMISPHNTSAIDQINQFMNNKQENESQEEEELRKNFKYIEITYKYYKTKETVRQDFLFQVKENFGVGHRMESEKLIDFYLELRFRLLQPSIRLFGVEFCSTSISRLFPFKEQYIGFVSFSILDLVFPNTVTNIIFRTAFEKAYIMQGIMSLTNHRGPYWFSEVFQLVNADFVSKLITRISMRIVNKKYDYLTSMNVIILGKRYSVSKNLLLKQFYFYTFIDHDEQSSKASPLDYCIFYFANATIFNFLCPHFSEDTGNLNNVNEIILRENNIYANTLCTILFWMFNYITGREDFIKSGGESNPGPMDFIKEWIINYMKKAFGPAYDALQEAGELAILSAHLMRLFTSISDALGSFMTGRAIAPIDFTCRISSLILSAYESHRYFGNKMRFHLKPVVRAQAGPFENVLISSVLAYGAPQFIKDLMRDVPKFTSTKILDDASWFYDLFGFIISIPRKVLSLFEDDNKEGVVSILTNMLLSIEDLFPFSSLCRIKKEMEICLKLVEDEPTFAIKEENQNRILEVDNRRKKIEGTYKSHKKNFPPYYVDTSDSYDKLCIKILKYKSDVRVEPVCIVLKGPKGTGKTVLMNRIVQMYKNSGARAYTDNIPSSVENKKFYDTYDDEEVYVVDDIGAKSKAQWSEVINQVSSAKYPLEAASLHNKNTKFFNSQLMLLSCNILPDTFGPTDGVADKEAFYRRILLFDFENVRFDGLYKGKIEVKRYDDTLGIKRFVMIDKFEVTEDTGQFDLVDIDEFLAKELENKMNIYNINKRINLEYKAKPIPKGQSLAQDIYRSFEEMISTMPGIDWIVGQMYDIMAIAMDKLQENKTRTDRNSLIDYKYYIMFITFATAASGLAIYYKMNEKNEQDRIVENVHLEYTSGRNKKKKFINMMAQGFTTIDGELETAVPQLLPYQNNVCVTTYHFQDLDGKSRSAKCRSLFSVDKILTTYHMFDEANKERPIYITARSGENILYDYMEVNLLVANAREDWIIFRLPDTAPKYMKKIKMADETTSFKMYIAVGDNKICSLGKSIGEYDFGIDYTYENYTGKLTERDIMYGMEEDGLCGSLLLTKDGRILGMHVAGIEYYDDNDKIQTRGIAKLLTNESYNFIMGVLSLSVNDKTNLDYEVKERNISGVYINTNDKCYGVEGTRYVKSPIYGVFPLWRKPALEIPKEEQDYKKLTEAMMIPVPSVNLEGIEFAEKVLDEMTIDTFDQLSEEQIVVGNGVLKRINPLTSTGHSLKHSDKKFYLDYEEKILTKELKEEMRTFTDKIVQGEYKFEDAATVVSKDELKDVVDINDPNSQPKKIRLFTNYHLLSTILFRFFFGNLLTYIMENREYNGIMIGINPLSKQWDKLARKLTSLNRKVFDGDYAYYDKNMHPVFQRRLNEWLRKRIMIKNGRYLADNYNKIFGTQYKDKDVMRILNQLLECIISTPIISKNKKFITTHGLPSGIFLTAFYNSCINKMYTAYIYRMVCPKENANLHTYMKDSILCFYGDDIIGAISDNIKHFFNPIAFSKVMKTLGLDFTPAEKGVEWTAENQFKRIEHSSFLKRSFYLHPKIKSIVAPLNVKSVEGTMNYVTDDARSVELIMDKSQNFQREMFLHPGDLYHENMNKLKMACQDKNLHFIPLSEQYLIDCYTEETYSDLLDLH